MALRDAQRIDAWPAFTRGLRQRSPFVLLTALLLVVAVCAGLELVARGGGISGVDEGRWVRFRNDDSGHLSHLMASLKKAPPSGTVVYLLGGSATMEMFLDEPSLGADIGRHAGEDVRVVSLAGHSETMAGSLVLVENLPKADHGLLAIGLAPARFTASPQDDSSLLVGYPYLLPSRRLRPLLAATPARLARADALFPGAIKYGVTYIEERVRIRLPAFSDIGYHRHYAIDDPPYPTAQKLRWARRDSERDVARYALYADYNFRMLEQLVGLARSRGFDVAFYDQPLNAHIIGPDWRGLVPAYRRRAEALAARLDVPYLRVGQLVRLDNEDFLDDYHLVVRGRLKWQPVLSAELGQTLRAGEGKAAAGQ